MYGFAFYYGTILRCILVFGRITLLCIYLQEVFFKMKDLVFTEFDLENAFYIPEITQRILDAELRGKTIKRIKTEFYEVRCSETSGAFFVRLIR